MADLAVLVRGMKEAQRSILLPGQRAMNRYEMAGELEDVFFGSTAKRFSTRGFGRWAPLKASTLRRHGDHGVLSLTGALHNSLMSNSAISVTREGFRYSAGVRYAIFHHKGKGVPRRTVVGLNRADRADAKDTIRDYIMRGI